MVGCVDEFVTPNAGTMAEQAITQLQRIVEATGQSNTNKPQSRTDSAPTLPPSPKRRCNRRLTHSIPANTMPYSAGSSSTPITITTPHAVVGQCLECEVKDAEIQALRRRIQTLQEHLTLALGKNSAAHNDTQMYLAADRNGRHSLPVVHKVQSAREWIGRERELC